MHSEDISKAKDFKGSLLKALSYNKKYSHFIIIAIILSVLASVFSIIGPDKLKEITNVITEGLKTSIDLNKIRNISFILVILYVLSFIFNYTQGFIMATVTNRFSKDLRSKISIKINKLPLSYFDNSTIGDVLSRITNDVDTLGQNLSDSIVSIVRALATFIGAIIMMFYTNGILALISILSSLIGFILMVIIIKKSQKYFLSVQEGLGNINGHIEEVFSSQNIVRVYNATEEMTNKFDKLNDSLFDDSRKSQFYSGLMHPIMGFIGNFGYVAVSIIGSILVLKGNISFGVIVAFMIYVRMFTGPLTQFAQTFSLLQSASAASERVFEFLEEKEMTDESNLKIVDNNIKGNLEFKNVKFGYNKDKVIIKNFNAKIKHGEKIAIVGPTGAGKTTIVNLLMKFYEVNSGDIIIDNTSIKDLKRESVHELFTMVLQDTWIFNGTIKENIVYNKKNISDKKVEEVCELVGLNHFIKTLPLGYDTVLGDIESLSSGQKQLLTIARSMLDDKPFIILDEATSNVDTRTEKIVTSAMDKLTKGKTSFIIAHRLSTIKNADLILVMKDGNIVELGNHKELLKKNGFYAELYNSQFQTSN